MIAWFAWAQVGVAAVAGLVALVLGVAKRAPNDLVLGGAALVELLLVVQVVVSIVAPFVGNDPTGSAIEYWVYLVTAVLIPPLAVVWALVERTRWSTVVIGVALLAIAVMVVRMHAIWFVQVA